MDFIVNLPKFLGYLPMKSKKLRLKWNSIPDWTKNYQLLQKSRTAIGDTGTSVFRCAFVMKTKISDFLVTLWLSRKILKGRQFVKRNSPLHSLEKQESKIDFLENMLSIRHLQLGKFPCPPKSPNGEFGGFWRFSDLRNAPVSNSPFCLKSRKSLQFTLKTRQEKSRMACHHPASRQKNGGKDQDRTGDTRIFSPLLYQLSYPATLGSWPYRLWQF